MRRRACKWEWGARIARVAGRVAWPFGELTVITAHLSRDSRPVRDPTKAAADAVRIGIHRFLRNLVGRGDTVASPLRVRQAFARHLERYLLVPSSRYAAPGARKARSELTGCLLYDPPAETRWAVSQ